MAGIWQPNPPDRGLIHLPAGFFSRLMHELDTFKSGFFARKHLHTALPFDVELTLYVTWRRDVVRKGQSFPIF